MAPGDSFARFGPTSRFGGTTEPWWGLRRFTDRPHLDQPPPRFKDAVHRTDTTKAALAAYKARGGLLGAAKPGAHRLKGGANPKAARRAGEVSAANAAAAYADLAPVIAGMRAEGLSLRRIAGRLNVLGHTTRRGRHGMPCKCGGC
jgi:hypothetical protein